MTKFLRNLSIKKKLIAIQLFSSVFGLVITGLLLLVFQISEFKLTAKNDLSTMAELIGNRSTAALSFDDASLAKENLSFLEQMATVYSACIYDILTFPNAR